MSVMPIVDAGGTELHWSMVGSGATVVFIHGGWPGLHTVLEPSELQAVEPWERDIADRFRFIRYARRGYSPSGCPSGGYDIDNQAGDLRTIVDAVGADKVHVVASSSGGPVGCGFAARFPDRTASLTLVGTGPDLRTTLAARPNLLQTLERLLDDLDRLGAERAAAQRPPEIAVSIDPLFMRDEYVLRGDGVMYEQRLNQWHEVMAAIPEAERARWLEAELRAVEAYLAWPGLSAARRVRAPTLVLHGEHDRAIPAREGVLLADAIPRARFKLYEGETHSLLWRHPPALEDVLRFIQEHTN
jgi:pimeloyl-ACP methyl ester carboxylesterase